MVVVFIKQTIERLKVSKATASQLNREINKGDSLTIHDRCDACGSQAYVSVTGVTGKLMFCGHDYGKIMSSQSGKEAMDRFAFETVDERDRLGFRHNIYI